MLIRTDTIVLASLDETGLRITKSGFSLRSSSESSDEEEDDPEPD
jgi:hypothetical protein